MVQRLLLFQNFESCCFVGNIDACDLAARSYLRSERPSDDEVKSSEAMLLKACSGENAGSCTFLGNLYLRKAKGFAHNPSEALRLFAEGCRLKDMAGCRNASVMYFRGDGVEKNDEKAKDFKQKAIDLFELSTGQQLPRSLG